MTRQRATVSEKKQRRAYVLRMIGEGWGLSELTTHVADLWGLSRKQVRRYVSEAHVEFVNDTRWRTKVCCLPASTSLSALHAPQ